MPWNPNPVWSRGSSFLEASHYICLKYDFGKIIGHNFILYGSL
jgi:hypothetical protein